MAEKTLFTLHYTGEPNEISADTLLNTLSGMTTIIYEVGAEYYPGVPLSVKVKAPEPGSFLIGLGLGPAANAATDLATLEMWRATIEFGTAFLPIITGLIALRKILKKEKPAKVEPTGDGNVRVENSDGNTITVNQKIYNTYIENPEVNFRIGHVFESLEKDEVVEGFELLDPEEQPTLTVSRAEFSGMGGSSESIVKEDHKQTITQRTLLPIVKPCFTPGRRWNVVYHNSSIGVDMLDEEFLQKIGERKETFAAGDFLDVDLAIEQELEPSAQVFINRRYSITKVYRKLSGPEQPGLFKG